MAKFARRRRVVDAVQWRGDNLAEVSEFLGRFYRLDDIGLRSFTGRCYDTDNVAQIAFHAWDDDDETAAPGQWIVIDIPPGEKYAPGEIDEYGSGQIMNGGSFIRDYEPVIPVVDFRRPGSKLVPVDATAPVWKLVWALISGAGIRR